MLNSCVIPFLLKKLPPHVSLFTSMHYKLVFLSFSSAIRNPKLSAHCSGVKVLLQSILDANHQGIQESLLLSLHYLLNNEETRIFLRPALDVAVRNRILCVMMKMILGPLTDNFYPKDKTPEKEAKWAASTRAVINMLKTWTGLIVLTSHPLGLKAIVDSLRLPSSELHVRMLIIFCRMSGRNF